MKIKAELNRFFRQLQGNSETHALKVKSVELLEEERQEILRKIGRTLEAIKRSDREAGNVKQEVLER